MFDINDKWQSRMIGYNGKKRLEAVRYEEFNE